MRYLFLVLVFLIACSEPGPATYCGGLTEGSRNMLVKMAYAEARGESFGGLAQTQAEMKAIVVTVLNRVHSSGWMASAKGEHFYPLGSPQHQEQVQRFNSISVSERLRMILSSGQYSPYTDPITQHMFVADSPLTEVIGLSDRDLQAAIQAAWNDWGAASGKTYEEVASQITEDFKARRAYIEAKYDSFVCGIVERYLSGSHDALQSEAGLKTYSKDGMTDYSCSFSAEYAAAPCPTHVPPYPVIEAQEKYTNFYNCDNWACLLDLASDVPVQVLPTQPPAEAIPLPEPSSTQSTFCGLVGPFTKLIVGADRFIGCAYSHDNYDYRAPEACNPEGYTCATFVSSVSRYVLDLHLSGNGSIKCDRMIEEGHGYDVTEQQRMPGDVYQAGPSPGHSGYYVGKGTLSGWRKTYSVQGSEYVCYGIYTYDPAGQDVIIHSYGYNNRDQPGVCYEYMDSVFNPGKLQPVTRWCRLDDRYGDLSFDPCQHQTTPKYVPSQGALCSADNCLRTPIKDFCDGLKGTENCCGPLNNAMTGPNSPCICRCGRQEDSVEIQPGTQCLCSPVDAPPVQQADTVSSASTVISQADGQMIDILLPTGILPRNSFGECEVDGIRGYCVPYFQCNSCYGIEDCREFGQYPIDVSKAVDMGEGGCRSDSQIKCCHYD